MFTIQTLSGTGALRLGFDFLHCFMAQNKATGSSTVVYYPSTTWANHPDILKASHFPTLVYRYLDASGCSLDFDGLCEDLRNAEPNSIFLFHMCGHNPTGKSQILYVFLLESSIQFVHIIYICLYNVGVDPTEDQWRIIYSICRERNSLPIFDNAYQGFVSGDPDRDAFPVRYFTEQAALTPESPFNMLVCCSFAKNFGLYGERVGALHVMTSTEAEGALAAAQLRALSRTIYSTCPAYGARLVTYVLSDPERKNQWKRECKGKLFLVLGF